MEMSKPFELRITVPKRVFDEEFDKNAKEIYNFSLNFGSQAKEIEIWKHISPLWKIQRIVVC